MIDDDFTPDRTQLKALGLLLLQAQNSPCYPSMLEPTLYEMLSGQGFGGGRERWLLELISFGLVHSQTDLSRPGFEFDENFNQICLTPAGVFYSVSRAQVFAENWRGLTEDLPQEVIDAPWPLQAYFSPNPDALVAASDRFVRFDDNMKAFEAALSAIDDVADLVRRDNVFATGEPEVRDQKLDEIKKIRILLENREGWASRVLAVGWAALGYLCSKFADGPIGEAASHAWLALQNLLGLS